jgi:subtilisin family serine protease
LTEFAEVAFEYGLCIINDTREYFELKSHFIMKKQTFLISFATFLTLALVFGVFGPRPTEAKNNKKNPDAISGEYIVFLKDGVDADLVTDDMSKKYALELKHQYKDVLKGFSATLSDEKVKALENDSRVDFVSVDVAVYASAKPGQVVAESTQIIPTGVRRTGALANLNKGTGVGVAIIDTGIDLYHPDLSANISKINKTCVSGTRTANDDNGHGTHVAGTIAAADNTFGVVGVAPKAKLFAVKVLNKNGSGTWSSVICGIDWVTANAAVNGIKVVNMSLGGGGLSDNNCGNTNNDALHKAICKSVAKGIIYVVAAGNDNRNAASSVPAAYDDAVITVSALADSDGLAGGAGAVTSYGVDDTFATFSNFGPAVDIGAPGVSILSTWKGGGYATISGTSMATPYVAGAAALYIASHPGALWTVVRDALKVTGEPLNAGHTDPSGLHSESVLQASSL